MDLMETETAWSRALRDPSLRDLPYKIETNEYGQLVMSPRSPQHSRMQSRIAVLLSEHVKRSGEGAIEFAIRTSKGVKEPDVAWMSSARWDELSDASEASPVAPEICIEVLSPSNTTAEMEEKRRLYFEQGAVETWICDIDGRVSFYRVDGEHPNSELAPTFPKEIGA